MIETFSITFIMLNWRNNTSSSVAYFVRIAIICVYGITFAYSQDAPPHETLVRLVDEYRRETDFGFVEVSVNGGEFAKICVFTTEGEVNISAIACRQLNRGPPLIVQSLSHSDKAAFNIRLGSCVATEASLSSCFFSQVSLHYSCQKLHIQCAPSMASDLEVVLVRSEENSLDGVPLVYYDGLWSPVCSGNLESTACMQLGLGYGNSRSGVALQRDVYATTQRKLSFHCDSSASYLAECDIIVSVCCGCSTSNLRITCSGNSDNYYYSSEDNSHDSPTTVSGIPFVSFFVIIIIFLFISVRFCLLRSRASQNQTNRRPFAVSHNSVPVSNARFPRQTTAPPSNGGSGLSSVQYPQTSFATEYSTPASFLAYPPPYSASVPEAYPPPVGGIGTNSTALPYAPQQMPHPVEDPNLPSYEEVLRNDRSK